MHQVTFETLYFILNQKSYVRDIAPQSTKTEASGSIEQEKSYLW